MKIFNGVLVYLLLQALSMYSFALSDEKLICPDSITYVSGASLSNRLLPIFREIYADLGCNTQFTDLPGRRGFVFFNNHKIDGELIRAELYLDRYKVPYITTEKSIFDLKGSLWSNPGKEDQEKLPLGYIMGIFWQESYSLNVGGGIAYTDDSELIDAYNSERIGRFLAIDSEVRNALKKNKYLSSPKHIETLVSIPIYHVLNPEFQKFMDAFNQYVTQNDPFKTIAVQ